MHACIEYKPDPSEAKPEGAVKWGSCPGPFCNGEFAWLFNSDCDSKPWCEGCIDEAHDRVNEALDVMNEPLDDAELASMEWEEERELQILGDEEAW